MRGEVLSCECFCVFCLLSLFFPPFFLCVKEERERERDGAQQQKGKKGEGEKRSGLQEWPALLSNLVTSFHFSRSWLPLWLMHPPLNRTGSLCAEVCALFSTLICLLRSE